MNTRNLVRRLCAGMAVISLAALSSPAFSHPGGHGAGMMEGGEYGYEQGYGPGMMGGGGPGYGGYGMGPGMMQGYGGYGMGPGMMQGYGMGPGMMGPGMMQGYGGYGMGPGMMGGYGMGPGMMGGYGYGMGPGMMQGYGGYGMGPGMMRQRSGPRLSGEQQDKLEKIHDGLHAKHVETGRRISEQSARLQELMTAEKPDRKAIRETYKKLSELQQQHFEATLDAQEQADAVLTKEQREQSRRYRPGRMMGPAQ